MPKRDPHAVLGVSPGASRAAIRAAWRRLAREHHPDLADGDPAAKRVATRRMAEINAAYEALCSIEPSTHSTAPDGRRRPAGPPPAKPTRPVTGRLDTTDTFRPRNATTTPAGARPYPPRQPPLPRRSEPEPLRASQPSGPLRRARARGFRRPAAPPLADALELEMAFGKFRGHTLGQIAAFEPSYIDWLAGTISRDPELVVNARVVQADLDRRGVPRRRRPERPNGPHPFQRPF